MACTFVVIFICSICAGFIMYEPFILELIQPLFSWLKTNPYTGTLLFSSLYFLWVPLMLPSSFLSIFGGYIFSHIFGPTKGFLVCWLAINLGHPLAGLMTFYISRHCMKNFVRKNLINRIRVFNAIDRSFETRGIQLAFLLRIPPLIYWNTLTYALGVSSCKPLDFFIGTIFGI